MPSQTKYIFEAAMAILLALITLKCISFFSSTELYRDPSVIVDTDPLQKTSSPIGPGRTLFINNCASCHSIYKKIVGPALAGIDSRIPDRTLLIDWIKNNQKVLRSGNTYFKELYKEYNNTPMPLFTHLADKEIEEILKYISQSEAQY